MGIGGHPPSGKLPTTSGDMTIRTRRGPVTVSVDETAERGYWAGSSQMIAGLYSLPGGLEVGIIVNEGTDKAIRNAALQGLFQALAYAALNGGHDRLPLLPPLSVAMFTPPVDGSARPRGSGALYRVVSASIYPTTEVRVPVYFGREIPPS